MAFRPRDGVARQYRILGAAVSNLTNLLLVDQLHWSVSQYLARMWLPALVAIVVSVVLLGLLLRAEISGRYDHVPPKAPHDAVLFRSSVTICVLIGPLVIIGIPPWALSVAGALVLLAFFAWRRRDMLSWSLLPWRLIAITLGLFLVVGFLQQHGLSNWLDELAGTTSDLTGLLRLAVTGAVGSNIVNNLPAYVALEPVAAASPDRMLALLVGTNLGPLITVWGSLATLLWRDRCRSVDVPVSASRFALAGGVGVPVLLVLTTCAVWFTG